MLSSFRMSRFYSSRLALRQATPLIALTLTVVAPSGQAHPFIEKATLSRSVGQVPVSGRVTQANGEGLPGVTVIVKGTNMGTTTAVDGSFKLDVPENSVLVFSSIGYAKREVSVTGATTNVAVVLAEDLKALDEVVVVGYGTQERGSVTGAVASVSGRDIASQPVADPTQAIQGRAAGVTVTQNSGAPGGAGGTAVRVRGVTSAGNNAPLYVVDGFPLPSDATENQLNSINPNDIESIDVLKDASATAIYGVRAANGVVIITTKRGKAGSSSVNVDAYRGVQTVWKHLDLLDAKEYATINNEARLAANEQLLDKLRDPSSLGEGSDWQKAVFRPTAVIQSYNLSALGGSEKVRYAATGGYFQQDGTLNGSNFERFTLRLNGDIQANKYIKIGNSLALTHLSDRQLNTGNDEFGVLNNVLQAPPTIPVYNPDGTWYEPQKADGYGEPNPVAQSLITNASFTRNRVLTTLFAEVEPLKGLRFRTNVGADLIFDYGRQFTPSLGPNSRYSTAGSNYYTNYNPSYLIENTLTYDRLFAEKHQVTLLLGQSAQEFNYSNLQASRSGYTNNNLQELNNGPVNDATGNSGTSSRQRLASYFGRANYDFKGKYLFSATARYDGSSAFAPGHKFGFFPGVSAGWRVSEEEFLRGNNTVSNLKIRAGYGKVGNPLNAGQFAYLAGINSFINYPMGVDGTILIGSAPTRAQNVELRWEDNVQYNLGFDLGFLADRFTASIDLYNRRSPNLISSIPPTLVSGTYEALPTNAINSYNRGIDLSLTSRNLISTNGGLSWTTNVVFSTYKSRIEDLGRAIPFNGATDRNQIAIVRFDQGQPFGSFYGFVADGLIQSTEELAALNTNAANLTKDPTAVYQNAGTAAGDIKFKDLNGDGRITDADRAFIGSPNPDFIYGLTNNLAFKGFDLTVFLQGSQGNDVYNLNRVYTEGGLYGNGNSSSRVLGRWTGPGTSTDVPRAVLNDPNTNLRVSSYFIEDASYMRIKLLTLGYNVPKNLVRYIGGQSLRVYATAQNLLTLTKYTGFDPEIGGPGIDRGIYPQSRVFMGGLSLGF
jgi:TonB-linked SusC/RagA family outer membrane protein